jgi:adenine deaminase
MFDTPCSVQTRRTAPASIHATGTEGGQHDTFRTAGLTKELHVVLHGLPIQRVQHGMPSAIRRSCAAVRLAALAKIQALYEKGLALGLMLCLDRTAKVEPAGLLLTTHTT